MTQSYNLSQLANNLNTAGQLDATDGLVGAVPAANGGTGLATYAVGDLVYASGTTTLAKLSDVAIGNALISGGVGSQPGYGKIGLTTHVSGTLPVANGGTGLATLPLNNVILGNTTSTVQSVAPGATGNLLTSDGTTWASSAPQGAATGPSVQTFLASGTFTVPAGITKLMVTAFGGGGGGGGQGTTSSTTGGRGGVCGGGTASISGLIPGASITVTVGAGGAGGNSAGTGITGGNGGNTTFGTYVTAGGGGGGQGGQVGSVGVAGSLGTFTTTGTRLRKTTATTGADTLGGGGVGGTGQGGAGGSGISGGGGGGFTGLTIAAGISAGPGVDGFTSNSGTGVGGAGGGASGGIGSTNANGGGGGGAGGVIVEW